MQVNLAGSYVTETVLIVGQTVTAGGAIILSQSIDLTNCEKYAIAIVANLAHTWSATGQRRAADGSTLLDDSSVARDQLFASASRQRGVSSQFGVVSPKVNISIANGDTVDHTYSVYVYKINVRT